MDLSNTIIPRSDQLNADDLIAGPQTFTIKGVRAGSSEQPVNIDLVEFPGRPFRPSKTVLRILVTGWGKESDVYAGRRFTLYRDETVKWSGQDVGGIRVKAMSHLAKPLKLALTVTRGKKAAHVVEPLPDDAPAAPVVPEGRVAPGALSAIVAGLDALGISTKADKLDAVMAAVGRDLGSATDLTSDEGATVLAWIEKQQPVEDEPFSEETVPTPAWSEPVAQPGSKA